MGTRGFEAPFPTSVLRVPLARCHACSFPILTAHDFSNLYPKLWVSRDLQSGQERLFTVSTMVSSAPGHVSQQPEGKGRGGWAQEDSVRREDYLDVGIQTDFSTCRGSQGYSKDPSSDFLGDMIRKMSLASETPPRCIPATVPFPKSILIISYSCL